MVDTLRKWHCVLYSSILNEQYSIEWIYWMMYPLYYLHNIDLQTYMTEICYQMEHLLSFQLNNIVNSTRTILMSSWTPAIYEQLVHSFMQHIYLSSVNSIHLYETHLGLSLFFIPIMDIEIEGLQTYIHLNASLGQWKLFFFIWHKYKTLVPDELSALHKT